ncbi:hypothetical protein TNIN_258321 [Trichonephila inaurata madagascariensis]|uniref:Uncharacterized protein n=1 Tax=Trichonephila inaurata madagascariensis TaxID=2747483 RepID=A0A8X6IVD8_9ARAC|nr:hypothetical protein TNIN_258321 [Trichonephila inaurata madagascariensis]
MLGVEPRTSGVSHHMVAWQLSLLHKPPSADSAFQVIPIKKEKITSSKTSTFSGRQANTEHTAALHFRESAVLEDVFIEVFRKAAVLEME